MKIITVLMAAFLAFAVYVQWNDPDPEIWMLIYGLCLAVTICSLILKKWIFRLSLLALIAIAIMFGRQYLSSLDIEIETPMAEYLSELGGLALCFVWLSILAYTHRKPIDAH